MLCVTLDGLLTGQILVVVVSVGRVTLDVYYREALRIALELTLLPSYPSKISFPVEILNRKSDL